MNLLNIIKKLNKILITIAAFTLVVAMVEAVFNMLLRPIGYPVQGSFEVMGFACAVISALGLGYSQEQKAHISVDIIFRFLPFKIKRGLRFISRFISAVFFMAVSYRILCLGITYYFSQELSETLRIPIYPITFLVSIGFFALSLTLFLDTVILLLKKD